MWLEQETVSSLERCLPSCAESYNTNTVEGGGSTTCMRRMVIWIELGVSVFESLYRADPYTSDHIVGQA